jgi:hypothetical protein
MTVAATSIVYYTHRKKKQSQTFPPFIYLYINADFDDGLYFGLTGNQVTLG